MTSEGGAEYRHALAVYALESARDDVTRARWRDAALFARAAVEHAVKAVAACFTAVPRTHDPDEVLRDAMSDARFPDELRVRAQSLLPELGGLGQQEHILLSYGDEGKLIPPWTFATEERARHHLRAAEQAVAIAGDCIRALFGETGAK